MKTKGLEYVFKNFGLGEQLPAGIASELDVAQPLRLPCRHSVDTFSGVLAKRLEESERGRHECPRHYFGRLSIASPTCRRQPTVL